MSPAVRILIIGIRESHKLFVLFICESAAWRSAACELGSLVQQEELEIGDAVLAVKRKIAEIEQVNVWYVGRRSLWWRAARS